MRVEVHLYVIDDGTDGGDGVPRTFMPASTLPNEKLVMAGVEVSSRRRFGSNSHQSHAFFTSLPWRLQKSPWYLVTNIDNLKVSTQIMMDGDT